MFLENIDFFFDFIQVLDFKKQQISPKVFKLVAYKPNLLIKYLKISQKSVIN